jgi:hypothetical protein
MMVDRAAAMDQANPRYFRAPENALKVWIV